MNNLDAVAVKLAVVADALVSMRFLQGSWPAGLSMAASGAGLAVFSCTVHDTLLERIGLSAVSLTALGTAFRIVDSGWASDGGTVDGHGRVRGGGRL
jgi:hypothetical protein